MSYDRTDKEKQRRSRVVRWGLLGVVLLGITAIVNAHQYVNGAGKPVGVDALCPFGGVETIFSLVSGAGFIEKTVASAVVLLVGTLVLAIVMRRSFCGQLCPLGALQGLFGALGRRIMPRRLEVPRAIDAVARYLKYVVLAVFTLWTWQAASLVMRPYDPWVAYAHITSSELFAEFAVGVGVLAVALVGSLVYERFFCKYLCPTGALLGILSKVSLLGIERDASVCINCAACDKACPMNIEVSSVAAVKSSECISCNECVNACPASGALDIRRSGGASISATTTTAIVAAIIVIMIGVSTAAGAFAWTMPTLGEALEKQHEEAGGEASAKAFDATLIKGYMSMKEIAAASGVPEEAFTAQWGVPASDLGKPMKEIKDAYGFSPDDVKTWVAEEVAK
jgi:ferredoxin